MSTLSVASVFWLALVALVGSASGSAAVLAPAAVKPRRNPVQDLSRSTTQLWTNYKVSQAIRAERKAGTVLDYADYLHLRRGAEDRKKLLSLAWYSVIMKWSTPLIVMINTGMQPSTFETQSAFAKRLEEASQKRTQTLLEALRAADNGAIDGRRARDALASGSKAKALEVLTHNSVPLGSLPVPVLKFASNGLGGPYRFLPRPLHMWAIREKLRAIEEGDAALRVTRLDALSRGTLAEACNERAISVGEADSRALRAAIQEWLALTAPMATSPPEVADTKRVALLALNSVSSVRKNMAKQSPLTAALYARNSF